MNIDLERRKETKDRLAVNTEEAHWGLWREMEGISWYLKAPWELLHSAHCRMQRCGWIPKGVCFAAVNAVPWFTACCFFFLLTCCLKHMCKLARVLLFILFKDDRNTKCCLMSFVNLIPFQKFAHIWFYFLCPLSVDTEFPVSFSSYTHSLTHFPPPLILQCPFYPINGRK